MPKYEIVREEREPLSEEACPVDLMSELYKAKAKEDEQVIFTLTSEAFRKMCAFPTSLKKEVTYFVPFAGLQSVGVIWLHEDVKFDNPSTKKHYSNNDEWLTMDTKDRGKTYLVRETNTEEIVYERPPEGSKVVNYIID